MNDQNATMPVLSIIIVNWNSGSVLENCLRSIYDTIKTSFEVIVVDNNSADGSALMLREKFPSIKLLEQKENLGYSKGNNIGVSHSEGEYLLILNPDTVLLNNAIDKMIFFLKTHPNVGMVSPVILTSDGSISTAHAYKLPTIFQDFLRIFLIKKILSWIRNITFIKPIFNMRIRKYHENSKRVEFIQGSCMLIKRSIFNMLGGFDESIPMYLDDIDICYRCKQEKNEIYFVSDAKIIHLEQYSTKKAENYKLYDILAAKGLLFYYQKHFGNKKAMLFRLILLLSVPYLLILDIFALPYFLISRKTKHWNWLVTKHFKYFELAVTGICKRGGN